MFTNLFNSHLSPFGYILIMQVHAFLVYDLCSGLDIIIWYIHRPFKLSMMLRLK